MAASRAIMDTNPGKLARDMANNMVKLADGGQWSGAEHVAARLRSAIMEVPADERREVILFVSNCLDRVKTMALSSRNEVTMKMSEVRRGRDAAKAYGSSLEIREAGSNATL